MFGAAQTTSPALDLAPLLHGLLKLWPLLLLVGLAYVFREARSSRKRARSRASAAAVPRTSVPAARAHRRGGSGEMAEIDSMSGTAFEKRLVQLFRQLGFTVTHTGRLGDFGADLVIEKDGTRTAVQAKCYARHNEVGLAAVREALGAKGIYSCERAMVVTNSTFSWRARKLAAANGVELCDRSQLRSLLDEGVAAASHDQSGAAASASGQHCARCGREVSERVRDYCLSNRDRFAGLVYCYEHQRAFRRQHRHV